MKDLTPFDAETLLMMEDVSGHKTKVNKGRAGFGGEVASRGAWDSCII